MSQTPGPSIKLGAEGRAISNFPAPAVGFTAPPPAPPGILVAQVLTSVPAATKGPSATPTVTVVRPLGPAPLSAQPTTSTNAATIASYSWAPDTTINPVTWELKNSFGRLRSNAKPTKDVPGMIIPSVFSGESYRPGGNAIAIKIDRTSPADTDGLQKIYYQLMSGTNKDAPQAVGDTTKYVGFAFKLNLPGFDVSLGV